MAKAKKTSSKKANNKEPQKENSQLPETPVSAEVSEKPSKISNSTKRVKKTLESTSSAVVDKEQTTQKEDPAQKTKPLSAKKSRRKKDSITQVVGQEIDSKDELIEPKAVENLSSDFSTDETIASENSEHKRPWMPKHEYYKWKREQKKLQKQSEGSQQIPEEPTKEAPTLEPLLEKNEVATTELQEEVPVDKKKKRRGGKKHRLRRERFLAKQQNVEDAEESEVSLTLDLEPVVTATSVREEPPKELPTEEARVIDEHNEKSSSLLESIQSLVDEALVHLKKYKERFKPFEVALLPLVPERKKSQVPKRQFRVKNIFERPKIEDSKVLDYIQRVENYIQQTLTVEDGSTILVGVSGGVDSVVLFDILYYLSYTHGYTIQIAHVNHQLRGNESKRDEKFVRNLGSSYGVICHASQVNVGQFSTKYGLTTEEAARELRYKFFRQTSSTIKAQCVATAHTADDNAETFLMNLFRGTGLTGLSGIPAKRQLVKRTFLVRPILCLSKSEVLEYATLRNLQWHEDSTNSLSHYTRNKVRNELLPQLQEMFNPNIIGVLNRTASLLRKADAYFEEVTRTTIQEAIEDTDTKVLLSCSHLLALHDFLRSEVIEHAVSTINYGRTVSFATVDRVTSLLDKPVGTQVNVVNAIIAVKERDSIVLMQRSDVEQIHREIIKLGDFKINGWIFTLEEIKKSEAKFGLDPFVEYFDYDTLPYRLFIRNWHAGDAFQPLGMTGHTKVADFLTNQKVASTERANQLVLSSNTDIVWVCGLRIHEEYKVTDETRRVLKVTMRKQEETVQIKKQKNARAKENQTQG